MKRGARTEHNILNVMTSMLVTCSVLIRADDETFCQENTIQTNRTGFQFTKDWSTIDYVLVERHKALHCCVEEYKTIEWYKDGHQIIYNFTNGTTFRLAKGSNNTRIFTDSAIKLDNGTYTCVASNGTLTLKHVVELFTDIEMNYEGPARWTGIPKDQYAQIGESASFFCEGFIGPGNDTNQYSQVIWMRKGESNFPKGFTEVNRDGNLFKGAYLHLNRVETEDYGEYTCQISNGNPPKLIKTVMLIQGDDPHTKIRTTYKATLILLLVFSAVTVLVALSTVKWHLEIRLFLKDRFGKLEKDDEKEYDAFVCYDQDDTDFALGVLVPTLERKYHYRCFAYERDCNAGDIIPETYSTHVNTSRRFIMVLSPSLARNKWCTYALYMAIEAMLNLHSKIICIILQDIAWTQDEISEDRTLQQVLRVVKKVRWTDDPVNTNSAPINITDSPVLQRAPSLTDSSSDILKQTPSSPGSSKFWISLRVLLPPRRPIQLRKSVPLTVIENSTASVLN